MADPRYQSNLEYGTPRPGHPGGKLKYHIAELEQNLEKLASEFIEDEDLLNRLQFQDVYVAFWKPFAARGSHDVQRFVNLLEAIQDWNLFLMFIIIDGGTPGKDP